jgi:predicted protein tyrosine phosphatase
MIDVAASYEDSRSRNAKNEHQGAYKRVLCVCSAGLLRSPTAALVLSQEPFGFNTRCAGLVPSYALIQVDEVLIHWADEIVCMERDHEEKLKAMIGERNRPLVCLDIQDSYAYRDEKLQWLIKEKYQTYLNSMTGS